MHVSSLALTESIDTTESTHANYCFCSTCSHQQQNPTLRKVWGSSVRRDLVKARHTRQLRTATFSSRTRTAARPVRCPATVLATPTAHCPRHPALVPRGRGGRCRWRRRLAGFQVDTQVTRDAAVLLDHLAGADQPREHDDQRHHDQLDHDEWHRAPVDVRGLDLRAAPPSAGRTARSRTAGA